MQEETRTLPLGLGQREEAQPRWKDARKQHRSVERDVRNRLHSILSDIRFTHQLHSLHFSHLPLIPNLRCGAWYVSPHLSRCVPPPPPTYFKSTDGHLNTWHFSLKRPNLAFLKLTLEKRGAVCVDSTRRGKILPDALSKTLPIWCAVLNEASFRRHGVPRKETQPQTVSHHSEEQRAAERHPLASLRTYLSAVSPQEHADIECRLHDWAEKLLSSAIHVARLEAPLVPFFITPSALGASLGEAAQEGVETDESASLTSELEAFRRATKDHNIVPVICVSASLHANAPGQEAHLPRTRKRKKFGVGVRVGFGVGDDDDESHLVAAAATETLIPRPVVIPSSASSTVTVSAESEASQTFTYVQGSGDDEESWSLGLNPSVFWKDPERILEEVDEIYATCADQTARNVACRQAFARLKDEEEEHVARVDRSEERSARPVEIPASGIWIGEDAPEQTMNFARFALILHTSRSASSAETFGDGTDRAEPRLGSAPSACRQRQVNLGWKAGKKGVGTFAHGLMSAVALALPYLVRIDVPDAKVDVTNETCSERAMLITGSRGSSLPAALAIAVLLVAHDEARLLRCEVRAHILQLQLHQRERDASMMEAKREREREQQESFASAKSTTRRFVDAAHEQSGKKHCVESSVQEAHLPPSLTVERLRALVNDVHLTKREAQTRTQWVTQIAPEWTPSRAHLNRVNQIFVSRH